MYEHGLVRNSVLIMFSACICRIRLFCVCTKSTCLCPVKQPSIKRTNRSGQQGSDTDNSVHVEQRSFDFNQMASMNYLICQNNNRKAVHATLVKTVFLLQEEITFKAGEKEVLKTYHCHEAGL